MVSDKSRARHCAHSTVCLIRECQVLETSYTATHSFGSMWLIIDLATSTSIRVFMTSSNFGVGALLTSPVSGGKLSKWSFGAEFLLTSIPSRFLSSALACLVVTLGPLELALEFASASVVPLPVGFPELVLAFLLLRAAGPLTASTLRMPAVSGFHSWLCGNSG